MVGARGVSLYTRLTDAFMLDETRPSCSLLDNVHSLGDTQIPPHP
jgi:hypothetical protein